MRKLLSVLILSMVLAMSLSPLMSTTVSANQRNGYYEVSTNFQGDLPNGNGVNNNVTPYISDDGRYVAFTSGSTNLVQNDVNNVSDVFRKDTLTNEIIQINSNSTDLQSVRDSIVLGMSSDGSKVLFATDASLVPEDTNNIPDIYVRNITDNTYTRASVGNSGQQCIRGDCNHAKISGDGRYIVFLTESPNLTNESNLEGKKIFRRDLLSNTTELIAVSNQGEVVLEDFSKSGRYIVYGDIYRVFSQDGSSSTLYEDNMVLDTLNGSIARANASSSGDKSNSSGNSPAISADGRYVTFFSMADNLTLGDINERNDVFIRDMLTGITEIVSVSSSGQQSNDQSYASHVSQDGRYVVFDSAASNLAPGTPTQGRKVVYIRDRVAQKTYRATPASFMGSVYSNYGYETITPDGKYIVFESAVETNSTIIKRSTQAITLSDTEKPIISATINPAANSFGWNKSSILVTFTCSDIESGIESCQSPINVISEGANQIISGTAIDNAGNTQSTSITVNLDKTKPTVGTPTINPALRISQGATSTVTATASDTSSGVIGGEWFIGVDPGQGNGNAMTTSGGNIVGTIPGGYALGVYTVSVRSKDKADNWSVVTTATLTVIGLPIALSF